VNEVNFLVSGVQDSKVWESCSTITTLFLKSLSTQLGRGATVVNIINCPQSAENGLLYLSFDVLIHKSIPKTRPIFFTFRRQSQAISGRNRPFFGFC
jgi:hypothetical protein